MKTPPGLRHGGVGLSEPLRERTNMREPMLPLQEDQGLEPRDFDRASWQEAVVLLCDAGMTDSGARRFFGKLLSDNRLAARDVYPAIQAAKRCGTQDPRSYLTKAIHNRAAPDPSLLVDWC